MAKKSNLLWDLKFTTLYISFLIYVKVFSIPQGSKAALHLSNANVDSALSPLPFKILKKHLQNKWQNILQQMLLSAK